MKGLNLTGVYALLTAFVFVAGTAEARHNKREGFNFGLGLRAISDADSTKGEDETTSDSHRKSSSQAVTPHVGYVFFDTVNIGLSGYFENVATSERFTSKDGTQEIDRDTDSTIKAGSLFMRFMFATYMHFEAGVGVYDRKIKVSEEYTLRDSENSFSGERTEYTRRGTGPGYHLGAGVEVPVTKGFYVSSNYLLRTIQLRDSQGTGSIGSKRSHLEQRELMFGLTHYID